MEKGKSVRGWCTVTRKRNKSELTLTPSPSSQNPRKQLKMSLMNTESDTRKPELPTNWSILTESEKLDQVMKKLLVIDQVEEKVDRLIDEREFGADLLLKVSSLEGKNLRLEKEVERLTRKVEDL